MPSIVHRLHSALGYIQKRWIEITNEKFAARLKLGQRVSRCRSRLRHRRCHSHLGPCLHCVVAAAKIPWSWIDLETTSRPQTMACGGRAIQRAARSMSEIISLFCGLGHRVMMLFGFECHWFSPFKVVTLVAQCTFYTYTETSIYVILYK